MLRSTLAAWLLLAAAVPACGGDAIVRSGGQVTLVDGEDGGGPAFTLSRETLNRVLAAGPSWLIQQVEVRPVLLEDEFYGFRLLRFFEDRASFPVTGLEEGDIVQRVNGLPIGTPDEFMAAWDTLGTADHLTVRVLRDGRPLLLAWRITDPRTAGAP